MEINGCFADFHLPKLKTTNNRNLPEFNLQTVYRVEEYDTPINWMHGSSKASSYFVGVEENRGMWLDFNLNYDNKKHVAIVLSIQGINPITGLQTKELCLEQYKVNCPIHNIEFETDRFCSKCKYRWPPQNYLTTTTTPYSLLWLDGFRTKDGSTRQYYFTSDVLKGVASQLIGEERVFAIGIAFYLSKQDKPLYNTKLNNNVFWPSFNRKYLKTLPNDNYHPISSSDDYVYTASCLERTISNSIESKPLEIAAGNLIDQQIYMDNENIDFWNEEPHGFIYLNYVSKTELKTILNKKVVKEDGFLGELKVGN